MWTPDREFPGDTQEFGTQKYDTLECNNYSGVNLLSVTDKVLTPIIFDRVRQKLLIQQRHEQSGFTPAKSTVDRILTLRVLTERLRDFRSRLFAAYVDLRGIHPKLVSLISGLYSGK